RPTPSRAGSGSSSAPSRCRACPTRASRKRSGRSRRSRGGGSIAAGAMTELLQQGRVREAAAPGAEAAARRALRAQIARLERELGALLADAFPRRGIAFGVGTRAGPRLLSLGELEALRDELAARGADARAALAERHAAEA